MKVKPNVLFWIGGIVLGSEIFWQMVLLIKRKCSSSSSTQNTDECNITTNDRSKSPRPEQLKNADELDLRKPPDVWNTVLFCPDTNFGPGTQLFEYIDSAGISINVCIFLASIPGIINGLIKKKRQGVIVRVITDYDTMTSHNNTVCHKLEEAGIPVRKKSTGTLMHNKFIVFDEEAVLTGSCNFTNMAIKNNYENLVITTNQGIVKQYLEEFETVWEKFDDGKNN